jgi:CelD/BcsL family acetyltransferase involved in cellulose biosynthesis
MTFDIAVLSALEDTREIGLLWRRLASAGPVSYFNSWPWIETWLGMLPSDTDVKFVVMSDASGPAIAFFLGKSPLTRYGVIKSNAYFLNETGHPEFDQLCIERNGVMMREGLNASLSDILAALPGEWDEFYVSGVPAESPLVKPPAPYRTRVRRRSSSYCVELDKVRESEDYLDLLSAMTRSQIRRSYRIYEDEFGPVTSELPKSWLEARAFFEELVALHQQRWQKKDVPGAFSNKFFHDFHCALIDSRFNTGEVQIVRVRAGDTTIGVLYNFVHNGTVSFYQSGFNYSPDNRLKPGLVAHTEAIRYNAAQGHAMYDLLSGDTRYKKSLATTSHDQVWVVISPPKLKFTIEEKLREWKRRMMPIAQRMLFQRG